jgi:hypothetical protein
MRAGRPAGGDFEPAPVQDVGPSVGPMASPSANYLVLRRKTGWLGAPARRRNTDVRSFLGRDRGRPIGGGAAGRKSALRSAARFARSVEQLRGKPCGWLARVRNRDDRRKLLRIRMLRAKERGVGRAEPHYDAAIFSHDVETISELFSRLFSRASILQQRASRGERVSDKRLSDIPTRRQAGRIQRQMSRQSAVKDSP